MVKIALRLFKTDFQHKLKNGKVFTMLALFVGFYALFVGLNMETFRDITTTTPIDSINGKFIPVPLSEPGLDFDYAQNFIPFFTSKPADTEVGVIFYPDRYQDINTLTPMATLFLFFYALLTVLFAYNELSQMKEKGVLQQILTTHACKKDLLRAKMLSGLVFFGLVWVLNTLTVEFLAWLKNIHFAMYQYKQIALFNFLHCVVLMIFYTLALAFSLKIKPEATHRSLSGMPDKTMQDNAESAKSTRRNGKRLARRRPKGQVVVKDSAYALLTCLVMLLIIFFVIPNLVQALRNFVYDNIAWNFPTEWYWYSRYLQVGDLVTTFGDLTTDLLFIERARTTYASIPWTHQLATTPGFTIYRLFWINWTSILTLIVWLIGAYIFAGRRLEKADVV